MSDNHCPYCKASISGPFHATGRDAIYQAEIDELKQENMELHQQLSAKTHYIITLENRLARTRTDNEN